MIKAWERTTTKRDGEIGKYKLMKWEHWNRNVNRNEYLKNRNSQHGTGGGDQNHPQEEKKQGKWFSEKTLQIDEKGREAKSTGEKERYIIWMQSFKE